MKQLRQNLPALALALALAGAALGIPTAAARREERALLAAARPRPALGGILWQEPVRQSPVLYALHRTALQGSMPGCTAAEPAADPAVVAAEAAALLDTLHAAGVVDDALLAGLGPLLASPSGAWRSADGGRFSVLHLTMSGGGNCPDAALGLAWHTGSGLPVAFSATVPGANLDGLDLPATAQACRTMLGLDALGDWVESDGTGRCLACTSAAGQARLTVGASGGYISFALAAEP